MDVAFTFVAVAVPVTVLVLLVVCSGLALDARSDLSVLRVKYAKLERRCAADCELMAEQRKELDGARVGTYVGGSAGRRASPARGAPSV